jgi:hypothetical protein
VADVRGRIGKPWVRGSGCSNYLWSEGAAVSKRSAINFNTSILRAPVIYVKTQCDEVQKYGENTPL